MKCLLVAAALLTGASLNAQADTSYWANTLKKPRTNAALQVDTKKCDRIAGTPMDGSWTSEQYKQCMASHGWRFSSETRYWVVHNGSQICVHAMFWGMPSVDCHDE